MLLLFLFWFDHLLASLEGLPGGSEVKASACNAGDLGSIPGSGRSPGEGNGNLLQCSCLENPVDGGAWWARVQRVRHELSNFTSLLLHWVLSYNDLHFQWVATCKLNSWPIPSRWTSYVKRMSKGRASNSTFMVNSLLDTERQSRNAGVTGIEDNFSHAILM